jgi:DNA-binding NarL/FixJ family response regulator
MAGQIGEELEPSSPIRILIADDHAVLRAGLRMLLDAEPDMQVIGEAADGTMALARVHELTPDVVLLDVTMPRMGGLETLRQIQDTSPQTRVLILTMHDDESYLREALAAGAAGYVLKRAADIELLSAIRAVYRGGTYLHAAHTKVLFENRTSQRRPPAVTESEPHLSPREEQVLRLVALGYTSRQAADKLHLSAKTVETYRGRLMVKLNLRNRAELVRYALRRGLLEEE